ncbi:MAG: GxxExxY protein [Bacteroidia bacterium]|nr:GxxExxY protein [Bacteroidia bacterium]
MENNIQSYNENYIGTHIVDAALTVHKKMGPGLLEKVYEVCMEYELKKRGFSVERQMNVPIVYDGVEFNELLKMDLLVNGKVIVELKSIENHNKLWEAQILSHLKLTKLHLGYLINFNVPLIKMGIKRFINSQ